MAARLGEAELQEPVSLPPTERRLEPRGESVVEGEFSLRRFEPQRAMRSDKASKRTGHWAVRG